MERGRSGWRRIPHSGRADCLRSSCGHANFPGVDTPVAGANYSAMNGMIESDLFESWDGVLSATEYLSPGSDVGSSGFEVASPYHSSSKIDYQDGDYFPFWRNEYQQGIFRHQGRMVAACLSMGNSIQSVLTSYTIGDGFTYTAEPTKSSNKELAALVQQDLNRIFEANGWEEGQFEAELAQSAWTDGEVFAAAYYHKREVVIRQVLPEFITEPVGVKKEDVDEFKSHFTAGDWKYGIHVNAGDRQVPLGFHASWSNNPAEYSYFTASNPFAARHYGSGIMHHVKRNVKPTVARGMPDYFPVAKSLVADAKLIDRMTQGASAQASIAWIEQFLTNSEGSVAKDIAARGASKEVSKLTGQAQYRKRLDAATVLSIPQGKTYLPGPMGAERNAGFEVVSALAARRIGIRWNIPEYMISADAGSTNYAASLVAESPFVIGRRRDQKFFAGAFRQILYKALSLLIAYEDRYAKWSVKSLADLKKAVYINVGAPDVGGHEEEERTDSNLSLVDAGLMSPETAAEREGLEPEVEAQRGAKALSHSSSQDRLQRVEEAVDRAVQRQRLLFEDYP